MNNKGQKTKRERKRDNKDITIDEELGSLRRSMVIENKDDYDKRRSEIGNALANTLEFRMICNGHRVRNDDELRNRINDFFMHCYRTSQMPTIEKLCVALGITRTQFNSMRDNPEKGFSSHTCEIINEAITMLSSIDAELVLANNINAVAYIFRSKNFYDMKDQADIVVRPDNVLEVKEDVNSIEEKYRNIPLEDGNK